MERKQFELMYWAPFIFIIYAISLFIFLGSWGVIETSEARYAEIAREMFQSGDFVHPQLLNISHYHKPPVTYWITALAYKVFGINSFSVRFFLQISILIQIVVLYKIVFKLTADGRLALFTVFIYGTMPLVLVSSRGLTTDAYLTTFVLLCILCWVNWRSTGKAYWLYGMALSASVGFLIKGPLILIVPISFGLGFGGILTKRRFSYHHLISGILFISVSFSWYGYLAWENESFLSYFLLRQTVDRVTHAEVFNRHAPFWYYLVFAPILALPWSILMVQEIFNKNRNEIVLTIKRSLIFWVALPLLLFSLISSKLVLYVLPLFPGVAFGAAYFLLYTRNSSRMEWLVFIYFILICVAGGFIFLADVAWGTDLIFISGFALIIIVFIKCSRNFETSVKITMYGFVFTFFLLSYSARYMRYNELGVNSTKPLADWILKHRSNNTVLVYNKLLPSLAFHLNKPVISIDDGDRYLQREVSFESNLLWKKYLYDLRTEKDSARLVSVLKIPSVLVVKGEVSPSTNWIKKYFRKKSEVQDWTIYFN